jgi:ATP-dependent Zn protease
MVGMNRFSRTGLFWLVSVLLMVFLVVGVTPTQPPASEVGYHEFVQDVKDGRVKEVVVEGQEVLYKLTNDE